MSDLTYTRYYGHACEVAYRDDDGNLVSEFPFTAVGREVTFRDPETGLSPVSRDEWLVALDAERRAR